MKNSELRRKVFIFDDQQLGLNGCTRYLDGQTYCFGLNSGPGFGLFWNPRRTNKAALVQNDAFRGCVGELWEVSGDVLAYLDAWYRLRDAYPCKILLPATSEIRSWATSVRSLRGAKMRQIHDYRDLYEPPVRKECPPEVTF